MKTQFSNNAGASRLFRPREAAEILKISRSKVYALIGSGQISCVKIGARGTRVPGTEIERLITEGTEGEAQNG